MRTATSAMDMLWILVQTPPFVNLFLSLPAVESSFYRGKCPLFCLLPGFRWGVFYLHIAPLRELWYTGENAQEAMKWITD